jgi:hypothetical protein
MPTVRLLNSSGKEQIPSNLITVKLELRKWADDLKIYNLCREIENKMRVPVFTNRNDSLYIIQLHSKDIDVAYWKTISDLDGAEVFVTDVRKI